MRTVHANVNLILVIPKWYTGLYGMGTAMARVVGVPEEITETEWPLGNSERQKAGGNGTRLHLLVAGGQRLVPDLAEQAAPGSSQDIKLKRTGVMLWATN